VIAIFYGTRPQIIKASVLRHALARVGPVAAVDTGQHYDHALHGVHYAQLEMEPPDAFLNARAGSHAQQTAAILRAAAAWLEAQRPPLVVVIGDTNSTLACTLAASKLGVPVAHVEAGLRSTDAHLAEEINRRCVDAIASILFAPSQSAETALRRERVPGEVHLVGDIAYDVLRNVAYQIPDRSAIARFVDGSTPDYAYVTLHRAELVDDPALFRGVVAAVAKMPIPVVFAVHPRTELALARAGGRPNRRVRMLQPLGYLENLGVLRGARVVITDSGGLQREAYWMGVPCVTVRHETEWVETVACGANRLVSPAEPERLTDAVAEAMAAHRSWDRTAYGDGAAAERIAAVLSTQFPAAASRSA